MKEIIKLEQKTPMWHFQADTAGCVLRATEVKPKLDRFLRTKEKLDKSWFVKDREDALDYKLWFVAPDKGPSELNGKHYPLFFGNMGGEQQKKLIFYNGEIKMYLFSLNDALIKCIKRHLFEFFATHSFGTRQDKGFGFFFPVDIDGEKGDFNQPFGAHYQFEYRWMDYGKKFQDPAKRPPYSSWEYSYVEAFKAIHYFHKLIRSGINEGKCYYKSLMYFYAQDKGKQWDKPTIRHHFQFYTKIYQSICGQLKPPYQEIIPRRNRQPEVKVYYRREDMVKEFSAVDSESKLLFRDTLGLASEQQWKAYKDSISIKAQDSGFVRFKSPILYRPVILEKEGKCHVYIHWDESGLSKLKDQCFTISHKGENRPEVERQQDEIAPLTEMHVYEDFSLEDYFTFISNYYKKVRKKTVYLRGGEWKNFYIEQIFSPNQENFSTVKTPNTQKP